MGGNQHRNDERKLVLRTRVNGEEKSEIARRAREAGLTVSEYMRRRALVKDGGEKR